MFGKESGNEKGRNEKQNEADRRNNTRVTLTEQIFVKTVSATEVMLYPDDPDDEGGELATTIDVSYCGLRLYLHESVVEGSTLALWIDLAHQQEKILLTGVVIWVHQSGEGYLVGVKLEENSLDDVKAWQALIEYKNNYQ